MPEREPTNYRPSQVWRPLTIEDIRDSIPSALSDYAEYRCSRHNLEHADNEVSDWRDVSLQCPDAQTLILETKLGRKFRITVEPLE